MQSGASTACRRLTLTQIRALTPEQRAERIAGILAVAVSRRLAAQGDQQRSTDEREHGQHGDDHLGEMGSRSIVGA